MHTSTILVLALAAAASPTLSLPVGSEFNFGGIGLQPRPIMVGGNLIRPTIKGAAGVARSSQLDSQPPPASGSDVMQDRLHYIYSLTHNKPQNAREFVDGGLYARKSSAFAGRPPRTGMLPGLGSRPRSAGEGESGAFNVGGILSNVAGFLLRRDESNLMARDPCVGRNVIMGTPFPVDRCKFIRRELGLPDDLYAREEAQVARSLYDLD